VRGLVVCRIEGQELRFDAPSLHEQIVDGLQVRLNPWDISQAWLCLGGELVEPLVFVADGPELGAVETDVTSLRVIANIRKAQQGIVRQAARETERLRQQEGYLTGRRPLPAPKLVETVQGGSRMAAEDLALAQGELAAFGLSTAPPAPAVVPAPVQAPHATPSERRFITDQISWARYCQAHPEDVDAEERETLRVFLRDNPAVATALGISA